MKNQEQKNHFLIYVIWIIAEIMNLKFVENQDLLL